MYPYFQQKRPNLQARETPAADPLRDFLAQNPNFGTLLFQVTGGQGAFPIGGAKIIITKSLTDSHALSITTATDESGKTEEFSLPAPNKGLSQAPGGKEVFAVYDAVITAPGYQAATVRDIPIFDGVTTIQPVELSPALAGMPMQEPVINTEPDL